MPQFDLLSNYFILVIFFFIFFFSYLAMYVLIHSLLKFAKILAILDKHMLYVFNYEKMGSEVQKNQKNKQLINFFKI